MTYKQWNLSKTTYTIIFITRNDKTHKRVGELYHLKHTYKAMKIHELNDDIIYQVSVSRRKEAKV